MSPHDLRDSLATSRPYGNFDLVKRVKLDFTPVTVSKWKSRVTGLTVVHLDYEAPIVNGYFTVATEIFDDTGCPHTLEHLVFMGSEKYPYKGIIDHLANRGFSNGTNAWTDTDHTAYTVSTAGQQGFLQILPIYVDHILYPTMTKAGYVTEVHHIDPKGEDSGVVYSEMQGRENTSGDLMALRMQRLMNPPSSGYRSETGGLMEALRNLSVEQIRAYHGTYYVPHNFSLIVAGKLSDGTESLLSVVQDQVEPSLIAHGQNKGPRPPGWKRPFVETASADRGPIAKTVKETIEFPEKDESSGELMIGFMGPPTDSLLESQALDHLGTYFTSSPTAPLNKEYIETENPLCTYIYFNEDARATRNDLFIYVGSVPTEHLDTFDLKLHESLKRIAREGIDMERMRMVIDRDERQVRSRLESSGGDNFSHAMITDFLYGREDGSDIEPVLNESRLNEQLRKWTSEQWVELLTKYYIAPERVVVRGKPSAATAERLEREEKARLAKQREVLGEEGLARAVKELEDAKAEHERPIPKKILTAFPVPDVKSISWIPVQSKQEAGTGRKPAGVQPETPLAEHVEADGEPLPFFVEYDHVKSDFVTVTALLSLAKLPNHLRPYINVYVGTFFSLPVNRHTGERLSHEDVVNKLDDETVSYDTSLGMSGLVPESFRVSLRVELSKYEAAVAWLRDLVYGSEFDRERLQISVAQIQSGLPSLKRDGNTVMDSVSAGLLFDESSTSAAVSVVPQTEFIPRLAEQLKEKPKEVVAAFDEIRKILTEPSGVRFSVAGNVLDLPNPRSVWSKYFSRFLPEAPLAPVPYSDQTLSAVGKNPSKKAIVVSLPTIESSFVTYTSKGVLGWTHRDYPALRIATEVLSATESYLWRYIRGSGLAYGAYASAGFESGLVMFSLYRSSNSLKAAEQGATVVRGLVDGSIELDQTTLDAAKSSIVFGVTRSVSSPGKAAVMSFVNQALKGVPQRHNIDMLERFSAVTISDVLCALRTYFLPLFDPASSVVVSVTAPGKADEVAEGLSAQGYEVERRSLEVEPGDEESGSEYESGSGSEYDSGSGSESE
ncbi:Metalloenzyme, LuxS/M16 peptidase-like protein [Vararia minispora EC-137]|uniref:Metalloenzyme, LuxS/M16 peptidase-like protein n=1 Tax=Vararia minispora EC-137 TaxID=1314806 RepID=A0ACB8QY86_9AGAM|nr:Metalloenzyme, LuxS/M16 peptidase-like protein [Vararia minispora EC-137]